MKEATPPKKTAAQQRQDAAEYAKRMFGEAVLQESPKKASGKKRKGAGESGSETARVVSEEVENPNKKLSLLQQAKDEARLAAEAAVENRKASTKAKGRGKLK